MLCSRLVALGCKARCQHTAYCNCLFLLLTKIVSQLLAQPATVSCLCARLWLQVCSFKRPEKPLVLYEFQGCPFCKKVRPWVQLGLCMVEEGSSIIGWSGSD